MAKPGQARQFQRKRRKRMLLNHLRERVGESANPEAALCPLCGDRVTPKTCTKTMSHWAHFPKKHGQESAELRCPHFESRWHLIMKLAYRLMETDGWEIELPVMLGGRRYLLDAVNRRTGQLREFVHTLSPYHHEKHLLLASQPVEDQLGCKVNSIGWIYDGEMFVRKHPRRCYCGYRSFLKPKSSRLQAKTGGVVHFRGRGLLEGETMLPENTIYMPMRDVACLRYLRYQEWRPQLPDGMPELLGALKAGEGIDFTAPEINPEVIQDRVANRAIQEMVRNSL